MLFCFTRNSITADYSSTDHCISSEGGRTDDSVTNAESQRRESEESPPSMSTGMTNESHVACTAAACAISHLGTFLSRRILTKSYIIQATWLARGVSAFHLLCVFRRFDLTRPWKLIIAITHIYDATTHPSLAQTATQNLQVCMSALKQMGVAWPCASRSYLMIGEAPRLGISLYLTH